MQGSSLWVSVVRPCWSCKSSLFYELIHALKQVFKKCFLKLFCCHSERLAITTLLIPEGKPSSAEKRPVVFASRAEGSVEDDIKHLSTNPPVPHCWPIYTPALWHLWPSFLGPFGLPHRPTAMPLSATPFSRASGQSPPPPALQPSIPVALKALSHYKIHCPFSEPSEGSRTR